MRERVRAGAYDEDDGEDDDHDLPWDLRASHLGVSSVLQGKQMSSGSTTHAASPDRWAGFRGFDTQKNLVGPSVGDDQSEPTNRPSSMFKL